MLRDRRPHLVVETHSAELKSECGSLLSEIGYRPVVKHNRRIWREHRAGRLITAGSWRRVSRAALPRSIDLPQRVRLPLERSPPTGAPEQEPPSGARPSSEPPEDDVKSERRERRPGP